MPGAGGAGAEGYPACPPGLRPCATMPRMTEQHTDSGLAALMDTLGRQARAAAAHMARASAASKSRALRALARLLRENAAALQEANARDLARASELSAPMRDRLKLTPAIIETAAQGCEQLAAMPDVIGEITGLRQQPSGIRVGQMRVPLGVFGMIYESRPNVTIEAAALSIKSGNACILRGGSEALASCQALAALCAQALEESGLPAHGVQLVIERISAEAKVPVIKHLDGVCHTYVDEPCDEDLALKVADNAKTQKYSPCNATETLLVARGVVARFLPRMAAIYAAKGVLMRCDAESLALLEKWRQSLPPGQPQPQLAAAQEEDWRAEYLAPIIAIKVVAGLDEAMAHINHYGSHHTDAILTSSHAHAQRFLREVDSASCMVNASTRFADGFEYGLGAEIGISTDKFHARGPVGIEGLTSLKWVVLGEGHIRQ